MDHDGAVREVAQVYEHIKLQHPVLLHSSSSSPSPSTTTTTRLAHNLLGQALRALNVALSVMKQQQQPAPPALSAGSSGSGPPAVTPPTELVKAEPGLGGLGLGLGLLPANSSQATASTRSGKRRRSSSSSGPSNKKPSTSSWVDFTTVPYEDGYEWRKYGEKKINGAGHTRSYFRCTYRDDTGCRATKHVQQSDDGIRSDPPVFRVTYNGKHTCGSGGGECTATATASSAAIGVANSSSGAAAAMVMKQEPPAVALLPPPPLVVAEPYSGLPFDRPPPLCHGLSLVPVGMRRFCGTDVRDSHGRGGGGVLPSTSTTSSCISGESSDEYSAAGGQDAMAARVAGVEAPADDVLFNDLELFLLCNSFKDY